MSSLANQMKAALASREDRVIRRSLPSPAESRLVDFNSNDYLSLSQYAPLRSHFISKLQSAPNILGSGGSRLLVNGRAHSDLEARLAQFFIAPSALLFNSGLDANFGFFSCVPQVGDIVVSDEYIHASVHDGVRASRVRGSHRTFSHNSVPALREVLEKIISESCEVEVGRYSVFVAVESLYSMDGTFSPLMEIVELVEELFPKGNGYVVVDEAHSTGIYGPQGRGIVVLLGLENRVLARLHTFGKALAGSGGPCVPLEMSDSTHSNTIAVMVTNSLLRDYMINYARTLIYTTSLSYANVIAVNCSFDMLNNGVAKKVCQYPRLLTIILLTGIWTQLAAKVLNLSTYFVDTLRPRLASIPCSILSLLPHLKQQSEPQSLSHYATLPSPIIAILTAYPRPLSAFLYNRGMNARPITWPTVPKGKDRVRVCLHAGNTWAEVDGLVEAIIEWADEMLKQMQEKKMQEEAGRAVRVLLESKL
jgi:8-amino-7-oxononanoate synthase